MTVSSTSFTDRYGRWAFIAGASVGIGRALSHGAAARGLDVFMVARGEEQLEKTAEEVRDRHGVAFATPRSRPRATSSTFLSKTTC